MALPTEATNAVLDHCGQMLTKTEYQSLKSNGRAFKMTRDEIVCAFDAASLPQLESFIQFQQAYGGYRPDQDVTYGIVGSDLSDTPRADTFNNAKRVRIDLDNRLQIRFWLDEHRLIYYEECPVAESFESYIRLEAYASKSSTVNQAGSRSLALRSVAHSAVLVLENCRWALLTPC